MPFYDPLTFDYLLLGSILAHIGQAGEAKNYLRRSVAMTETRYGENHLATYFPRKALSDFYSEHNDLLQAQTLSRKNSTVFQHFRQMCPDLASAQYQHHWYIFRLPPTATQSKN